MEPHQGVGDTIGKTAFLADLRIEAGRERPTAEDVIDQIGCNEIGVAAL